MKHRRILAGSVQAWFALALALAGCSAQDEPPIEKKPAPVAHPVVVQEAKVEPFSSRQTFIGTVTAEASGSVVPQVTGTISSLLVKKGDAVKKGQVIGEIDPTQKLLEVKEAETRLAEARARLTQAEAVRTADESRAPDALSRQALENARETYERVKKLVEAGALPASQLDAAEAEWIRAQSNYRAATVSEAKDQAAIAVSSAQLEGATITWEKAKKALRDTKIKAPLDGIVNHLPVAVGDPASPQAAIAEIISLDHVVVTIQAGEDHLPALSKGKSVQVSIPALGLVTEAQISFAGLAASPETKLYPVEIRLANPDHAIRPGMRADVTVAGQSPEEGIVLPVESVMEEDGRRFVFVVTEGRAIKREVETRESRATSVLIGEGIAAGELVVVRGQSELKDGDLVEMTRSFSRIY